MPDNTHAQIPSDLETFVTRIADLAQVFGPAGIEIAGAVRDAVIRAMAARDRGDVTAAMREITRGMDRLSALADQLAPDEATLMRAMIQNFGAALARGDQAEAKQAAATMFDRSGTIERKRQT